jgi:hypothetical protein
MGVNELVEEASADALPGSMSSSFVDESRGVNGKAFAFKEQAQAAVEAEALKRQLFEEQESLESLGERASRAREPQKPRRLEQLFEQPESLRSLIPLPPSEQEAKHDSSALAETQAEAAAGTQCNCVTGTKVQILTLLRRKQRKSLGLIKTGPR